MISEWLYRIWVDEWRRSRVYHVIMSTESRAVLIRGKHEGGPDVLMLDGDVVKEVKPGHGSGFLTEKIGQLEDYERM